MRRILPLLLLAPVAGLGLSAQVLYLEDFEGVSPTFQINTTDVNSVTFGENYWDINNAYAGGSISATCLGTPVGSVTIPTTPAQPSGISNANGKYLHIVCADAVNSGVLNAAYKSTVSFCNPDESYFAKMSQDVSTVGLSNVTLSFWWLCMASPAGNAYGEVYYSTNSGSTWVLISSGVPTFAQVGNWTQTSIHLPQFDNQPTLRFGFRFVNNNETNPAASSPPFSIDDVKIEVPAAVCTAPSVQASNAAASSITQNAASINWTNGNGAGRIVMINTVNNFTSPANGYNPTANTVYAGGEQCIFNGAGSGPVSVTGLTAGTTYYVKVMEYCSPDRVYNTAGGGNETNFTTTQASQPSISTSALQFSSICPGGSVTVAFTVNNGPLNAGNVFSLEMSDATGSFASPTVVGTLNSTTSGAINGTIPTPLAPGNYSFRVVSSNPALVGTTASGTANAPQQPVANVNVTPSGLTVNASTTSTNATSYTWNPGDGSAPQTTSGSSFSHTYLNSGSFNFCLVASNACYSDTACQMVTLCGPVTSSANISTNGFVVSVVDQSSGADSVIVDFGNGTTNVGAAGVSFNYTYTAIGSFDICVIAFNSCNADTTCQTVTIPSMGIDEDELRNVLVYPNPGQVMNLQLPEGIHLNRIDVLSVDGRMMGSFNSLMIPAENWAPGVYIVRIHTDKATINRSWIKE